LAIYLHGGAWLLEQSRDSLFVLVISGANSLLGQGGYEVFRGLVVGLFFCFIFWLAVFSPYVTSGRSESIVALMIAVQILFLTRASVQIREGLAVAIFLIGYSILLAGDLRNRGLADRVVLNYTPSFAFFVCAMLMHGGVVSLFVAVVVTGVLHGLSRLFRNARLIGMSVLWMVVPAVSFIFVGRIDAVDEQYLSLEVYGREIDVSGFSVHRGIYWSMNAVLSGYLFVLARQQAGLLPLTARESVLLPLVAGPFLLSVVAVNWFGMLSGLSALVMIPWVRTFQLLVAFTMLLLAVNGATGRQLAWPGAYVLTDQMRTLVEFTQ
jgi:hypothetical protein